ncbi:MAG: hypothetical protein IJ237_06505 [Oscillospiraceae bacterium]|nr:hypothetical protein [Oscillospiraceae bacterium]
MGGKKQKYEKKPFESTLQPSDTSANIYESMMLSTAWQDLSASARVLYLTCKSQYYSEKKKPVEDDRETFTMNQQKWAEKYHLYTKENHRGFQRDMESLIMHGFVKCVECGAVTRTKSIYKFSADWMHFDPSSVIEVDCANMTDAMRRKIRKKEIE